MCSFSRHFSTGHLWAISAICGRLVFPAGAKLGQESLVTPDRSRWPESDPGSVPTVRGRTRQRSASAKKNIHLWGGQDLLAESRGREVGACPRGRPRRSRHPRAGARRHPVRQRADSSYSYTAILRRRKGKTLTHEETREDRKAK